MPSWSAAEDELLRKLWNEGLSGQAISKALIAAGHERTRNAVIGHAHRLGLDPRANPIDQGPRASPEELRERRRQRDRERDRRGDRHRARQGAHSRKSRAMPNIVSAPQAVPAQIPSVTHRTCQWIEGEPTHNDACKCGAPSFAGAYCQAHYLRSFTPRPPRADRRISW